MKQWIFECPFIHNNESSGYWWLVFAFCLWMFILIDSLREVSNVCGCKGHLKFLSSFNKNEQCFPQFAFKFTTRIKEKEKGPVGGYKSFISKSSLHLHFSVKFLIFGHFPRTSLSSTNRMKEGKRNQENHDWSSEGGPWEMLNYSLIFLGFCVYFSLDQLV